MYLLKHFFCPQSLFWALAETQRRAHVNIQNVLWLLKQMLVHIYITNIWLLKSAWLTFGFPRPSCLSIISARVRMIFPPWVMMDCLSQVTKSGRFNSCMHTKVRQSHLCHLGQRKKQTLKGLICRFLCITTYFCLCLRPITWWTISGSIAVMWHSLQA